MENKKDEALTLSNARLLSAAYFVLLAIIITILIDTTLYAIGVEKIMPTFKAILLAVILAGVFGALFGEKIVHCPPPYRGKAFLWGFLMVLAALPFYDVALVYFISQLHTEMFDGGFINLVAIYFFVLVYSFILAGLWLAIAAGFAAMYLRGRIVYDILHSQYERKDRIIKRPEKPK